MEQSLPLIGDAAPEFTASTTNGKIKFPDDFAGKWVVFFSHPADFTPVCTTEFIEFQNNLKEFEKINTTLLGLSVGGLTSHLGWFDAISKMQNGTNITFPLIDDLNMNVAKLYGMIQAGASDTHAVRAVFIIDPNGIIRTVLYYPASLGRNMSEIWRILVALQTADAFGVATPANWTPGDEVLTPAPTSASELREHDKKIPWFMNYKKLDKKEIYDKICKKNAETK
ncbi:MAG: peroxiredoxin [Alphaproteobacteria bacterium]|nr:peroxiredoxin [Alphaproteobacteria bacterium]